MKIMFNTSSLGKGGAERVISILANKLIEEYEVDVLVNKRVENEYKINNKVKVLTLDNKNETPNNFIRNIKRMKNMKKIIDIEKPSIIISFLPMPSYRALLLKNKFPKIPIIVSDRNDPNEEYKNVISHFLMKKLYKRADGFVFQTNQQSEYFDDAVRNKSTVIFNPVKNEFLSIVETEKTNTIINVGRLVEQKNQKMLINAFKKIVEKNEKYNLKIFGEGPLKNELQRQINELGLDTKIQLCGISNDIKKELEKAKLFVLSSNYEGMPNALIEAMVMGLPVISTDCPAGGPKELIEHNKNGILIPTNNENELANQMLKILNNNSYAEKLGENAKNIVNILKEDNIVSQWKKYIKTILQQYK